MKTILSTVLNNTILYLSHDGLATDNISRARCFRDLTDASIEATRLDQDTGWTNYGIEWEPQQVLFNEEQELVNQYAEIDRPMCRSHR